MRYRLRLFGPPVLLDEAGESPAGLGPGKPLAVLCYLSREGEVRRETVTALLWGESSESKARNAFRQALHRLRSALGPDMVPHDPDTVRIAAAADLWVDTAEFERALAEGRPEDAVDLVTGDFLEGFAVGEPGFDHWADRERARLRGRFLGALREAAKNALTEGRLDEAVLQARRLAEEDPLDSAAAVLEAKTLTAAGRGEEAQRLLTAHADRYRDEVGDEPPEEVAAALAGLRDPRGDGQGASDAGPGELVLRPDALKVLLAAWRAAAEGEAGVVLLEGEQGSGKTWLLDEVIRRSRPLDRPIVLRGEERMGRHGLPYAPVAEALRGVLRARGLAGASTHLLAEAARLLPELRDRFDLPIPPPIDDDTGRLRFYEGVASVLDAVAFEQPVLLALEALDRTDPPTLELVQFLASRLGDASILFVLSYDGANGRAIRERFERAERVALAPLDATAIEALLEARLPGLGPMARAQVAAASDGHPGRALELGQRQLRGEPIGGPPVPLRDALSSRLVGRSPRERRILLVLALVGRPLPIRLVSAASHLPEGAVLDRVAPLRAAALLREREHGVELPEGPLAELVLETAGGAGRGLLAGWTLEALAAESAAPDAELARLAIEAGRPAEAARYAEAAGRTAARVGAYDLAREHLKRALDWSAEPGERARLERALAGLGAGGLRLGAGADAGTHSGQGAASAGARGADSGNAAWDSEGGWQSADPARAARGGEGVSRSRLGILLGALGAVLVLVVLGVVELPDLARGGEPGPGTRLVRDTLVLVRTDPDGGRTRFAFTGDPSTALDTRPTVLGLPDEPRWMVALRMAGLPALASSEGDWVAVEGRGDGGERSLLAVAIDRSDTVTLDTGAERFDPLGWGPEGRRLLYARQGGSGAAELWAAQVGGGEPVPIDTATGDVEEAVWSPDGTRVAWTVRTGGEGGRGVFVAFADGTDPRPLTAGATDDYHLVWAPDGQRVAFTSDRAGNAEIFAVEVRSGRLWRLTWDEAHDDRPAFSPDGEFLAFESTRGGEAAVYVISSWGGQPQRVTAAGQRVRHDGWRGYPPPHLSHLRFHVPAPLTVGESAQLSVEPVFNDYVSRNTGFIRWRALDRSVLALADEGSGPEVARAAMADTFVVARGPGLARIVASAGGWREDTVFVKVGSEPVVALDTGMGGAAWMPSQGGLLSSSTYPVDYGLSVDLTMPTGVPPRGVLDLALVSPRGASVDAGGAPVHLARLTLDLATGEVRQIVEREEHRDRIDLQADPGTALRVRIEVGAEGRVSFVAGDGAPWRSSLRLTGAGLPVHRVRVLVRAPEPVRGDGRIRVVVGADG